MTRRNQASEMTLNQEQLEALLKGVVHEVVEELKQSPEWRHEQCTFTQSINLDQHKKDHEAMQSLVSVFDKIDQIRWAALKAVVNTLAIGTVLAVLALLGLKIKTGGGGP